MRPSILWTPLAQQDILDIYVTIGLDNPSAAERVFTAIEDHISLLIKQPRLGTRRPDIAPSTRILIESPYLVLYETHPNTDRGLIDSIEIVRIVHGHRNLRPII